MKENEFKIYAIRERNGWCYIATDGSNSTDSYRTREEAAEAWRKGLYWNVWRHQVKPGK